MQLRADQLRRNMIVKLAVGTGRVAFATPTDDGRIDVQINGEDNGLWDIVSTDRLFTIDTYDREPTS